MERAALRRIDVTLLICLVLTSLALLATVVAARRRRPLAATRLLALALLPVGAYLPGLLTLATRVADAAIDWATGVILNPALWAGVALLGVAVVLFVGAGLVSARRVVDRRSGDRTNPPRGADRAERVSAGSAGSSGVPAGRKATGKRPIEATPAKPAGDDEFAEIEEILRRRGI